MTVNPDQLHYRPDGPMCPHCGVVQRAEEAHHFDESWTEGQCGSCHEPFEVEVYYAGFRWTTRPKNA